MGIRPQRDGKRTQFKSKTDRDIHLKDGSVHTVPPLLSASFTIEFSDMKGVHQNIFKYSVRNGSLIDFHSFVSPYQSGYAPNLGREQLKDSLVGIIAYHYMRKVLQQTVTHPAHKNERIIKVTRFWKTFDVWEDSITEYERLQTVAGVMIE